MFEVGVFVIVFLSGTIDSATLELFELPSHTYPNSLCNDGTHAGYYHDTNLTKLDKIHVHLNGGNLCDSDATCLERCDPNHDGIIDNSLCTASTKPTVHQNNGLFSDDEENPLHDFWHVMVPYCSSDTWAGTGKSQETGYFYRGKELFRSVMNSLSHHFNLFEATELVLSGSSAGAFGVGLNCDDVADWILKSNPNIKVRCIADSPDFIPWWVHSEDCPRREDNYQKFVNGYWSRDMDHSCQEFAFDPNNNVSKPEEMCGILSQSLPFIKTDTFILVSMKDTAISRDYGCFHGDDDLEQQWMEAMYHLIIANTDDLPNVGWFAPSCPLHVIYNNGMNILVKDIHTDEKMSPFSALKAWMEGGAVYAVDNLDEENETCPK